MADQQGSTLSGNAAAFVPTAAAPPVLTPLTPPPAPATKGRGRGRERAAVEVEVVDEAAAGAPARAAAAERESRSDPRGDGLRAAARAALEATGSVEAAISALDPATAPPWTRSRPGATRTTCCASRRNGPNNNHRRGARPAAAERAPPRASPRGARARLVAAGVASFACDADEAPPWDAPRRTLLETRYAAPSASRTKLERRSSRAAATVFARRASCATVRLTTSAAGSSCAAPFQ